MRRRQLAKDIQELCFGQNKITLVSGPRQCGKTTLAKTLLGERKHGAYYNWDETTFRRSWVRNPSALVPDSIANVVPLLVLDEIHKDRSWKRRLKGIYDTLRDPCDIMVTGSARLDIYKKGSDSLLGRYFSFRLHPFTIRELDKLERCPPEGLIKRLFEKTQRERKSAQTTLDALLRYGPFPEPLLAQNDRKARMWRRMRREIIIREDLRDISRIPELSRVELMVSLLPERVGSLFSLNSLREDMEVAHETVKRWITYLKSLYYLYEIKPYHKSIPRALKKEGKIYLWDYGEVRDMSARLENLVANHLLKACHLWTDTGYGEFDLFYLRNKEKEEIDFLLLRDGMPWLPVEVKLSNTSVSPQWKKFLPMLPCQCGVQIVRDTHWRTHEVAGKEILVGGAAQVLDYFP